MRVPPKVGYQGGWISIALGAASLASSLWGSLKGAESGRDTQKAKNVMADNVLAETEEGIRRQKRDNDYIMGENENRTLAGGMHMSGSAKDVQTANKREFAKQINWIRDSGVAEADALRKGGAMNASAARTRAISGAIGGGVNAAKTAGWIK